MTFHFPLTLRRGGSIAPVTALSVTNLPIAGINCDCAYILTDQVADQMPGLYLHDGLRWRYAMNKPQLDSCVVFGRAVELYYDLTADVTISAPALIFRNSLPIQGTTLDAGGSAVFAVALLPTSGPGSGVSSFNNRTGAVSLVLSDVTGAGGAPLFSPAFTGVPTAPTPLVGDASGKIATTAFVEAAISALPPSGVASFNARTGEVVLTLADVTGVGGAPLNSPALTGIPSAPTAAPGTSTTQLATTAFVMGAVTSAGVASFNARTGAVTLTLSDITDAGGAPISSPTFVGIPSAPTAALDNNSTQLATTAFVQQGRLISGLNDVELDGLVNGQVLIYQDGVWVNGAGGGGTAGVASFNGRTGAVNLTSLDVTTALGYTPPQNALEDAPVDGKLYGRIDAQWSEIPLPEIVLGPLESVQGAETISLIQDDGSTSGTAVLRALQSSNTITVNQVGGVITLEGTSSVVSVAGVSPVDGDVPLTAQDLDALPLAGGTMTGPINMGGQVLTGLADPVNGSDAVTLNSLGLMAFDPGEY